MPGKQQSYRKNIKGPGRQNYSYKKPAKQPAVAARGIVRTSGLYGRFGGGKELKYFDRTEDANSYTDIPTSWVVIPTLLKIPQGESATQRVGNHIRVQSLQLRGALKLKSASGAASTEAAVITRMVVYIDHQCNGKDATAAELMGLSGGTGTPGWADFRNMANNKRFTILSDKFVELNTNTMSNGSNDISAEKTAHFQLYKKLDLPIEYDNTTGEIGGTRDNVIGVMFCASGPLGQYKLSSRVRFKD